MAKKSTPKKSSPKIGQQTKTTAKGAHGGGVKYGQVSLGKGFKNLPAKGANAGKSASKLPQPKSGLTENPIRPSVAFGKGFGPSPFVVSEAKPNPVVKAPKYRGKGKR
jgi:hypothetical protein